MIGIILLVTTRYGSRRRQSMIHVQSVGVFQTVDSMASGTQQDLRIHHMTDQTREYHLVSLLRPLHGILLRVFATAALGRCSMSATTAAIGQLPLTATTRTNCTTLAMAVSIRGTAAVGRAASQSVVSKNQNNLISVSMCPSVARAYGHAL